VPKNAYLYFMTPTIVNRKALHEYNILERYTAGLVLTGPEVKSLRTGAANLQDAFCAFKGPELYLYNMHIAPYEKRGYTPFDPRRPRKLLLHKEELKRLQGRLSQKGLTLIPLKLFFSERGYAKVEIALAQGKKLYDRRHSIQERESRREAERLLKRHRFPD
jgi:SsrA-binding protein